MIYGLVGEHLPYSYSKLIHAKLGYDYDLFSLGPEAFRAFIANRQYGGLNITIPYKQAVMPFCDRISGLAREIGAVNTLYFREGKLCGANTDYQGFLYMSRRAGIDFTGKRVLILGSGGAGLMARKAAADAGAAEILTASRGGSPGTISYEALGEHDNIQMIVNTTPVGTYPRNGERLLSLDAFPQCAAVMDVIYNSFATDLLLQAKAKGLAHSNGLPMLVAQATAAAECFFPGAEFRQENDRIIRELEADIENIILIGMPGCGKSFLGSAIAGRLGKPFIDLDAEIEKQEGKKIPEIFAEQGEEYFRQREAQAAETFGREKSRVIATGGGVILRQSNMAALKQNGRVIWLDRPLEALEQPGRPLSKNLNALKTMEQTRKPLYNKYSDFAVPVTEDPEQNIRRLLAIITGKEIGGKKV